MVVSTRCRKYFRIWLSWKFIQPTDAEAEIAKPMKRLERI